MRAAPPTLLVAAALAGCGASAPAHTSRHAHRARASSPIVHAQATHEYPSPSPPRQNVTGSARSPAAAVAGFARAYINWTSDTLAADMRGLAARSVGQARAATDLAAAEAASDYELQRDGIANSGAVEALAPLPGRANQYVVVTREQTAATATTAYQGLGPAWHVAIATVVEVGPAEWVVSRWQPQS